MAKSQKNKKEKMLKENGYVISIKLNSLKRKGEQAYLDIVTYLFEKNIKKNIGGDDRMLIMNQHSKKVDGKNILYGTFARYTNIQNGESWIDDEERKAEVVETPKNKYPNLKEVYYVFVPACHRFYIQKSTKVSWIAVTKYLNEALKEAINSGEQFEVNPDRDRGDYDKIYTAQSVDWIEVHVSYTNDDTNESAADLIDKQLKKIKAGKAAFKYVSDAGKSIDLNEPLVKGAIELSKTNGYTKARIKNKKYQTIDTSDHAGLYTFERKETQMREDFIASELLRSKREEE